MARIGADESGLTKATVDTGVSHCTRKRHLRLAEQEDASHARFPRSSVVVVLIDKGNCDLSAVILALWTVSGHRGVITTSPAPTRRPAVGFRQRSPAGQPRKTSTVFSAT